MYMSVSIDDAREVHLQLKKIWSTKVSFITTKNRLFNPNTKSVLLCGKETLNNNQIGNQKSKVLHQLLPHMLTIHCQ